jgi:Na+/proline symporter
MKRDQTPGDHFLAGRNLGAFVLFLTLYATAYSGNSLLGYPGKAYQTGFSFVMATGFMMAIIVVFHLLAPRLRPIAVAQGFITPGDWVRYRFDSGTGAGGSGSRPRVESLLGLAVGLLMTVALGNFLLAQLRAMGFVTSLVTGGRVPFEAGVVGLAVLILFYETRGGMRAVAWTDAAQGVLMMVGLAALSAWLVSEAGGLSTITLAVQNVRPEAVRVPNRVQCVGWFSTILLLGLASVLYPQAIQRIYAARSGRALQRSFAGMSFMPLATTLVVTLIGIAAIPRIDIELGIEIDGVMPILLSEWAASGAWGAAGSVVVFLGALAAIMSTADSCLLSLGSLVARDLLGRSGSDPATTRLGKWIAGAMLFATIPLALWQELTLWRLIELKMELLIQCVPAFLLALHWKRQAALPTLLGLAAGTLLSVFLTLTGTPRLWGVHVGILGLVLNLSVVVAGTWLTPRRAAGMTSPVAASS